MNAMTRDALISHIAAEMGVSKKLVRELFSEFLALAIRELKSKGVFAIPGLAGLSKVTVGLGWGITRRSESQSRLLPPQW